MVVQVNIKSVVLYFNLSLTSSVHEVSGQSHVPAALYQVNLIELTL